MTRRIAAAAVVAAAVLAACLSLPPYRGKDQIKYTEDPDGSTITGSGFTLHFAGGSGFHLPDSLKIGGVELMGRVGSDPKSVCSDESETGVRIAPTPRISADGAAPAMQNQLTAVLRGPVVVQVKLDWATQFACAPHAAPGGSSTFTVFSDGRIVRHDKLNDPMQPISVDMCECPGASNPGTFYVSSFWTFAQAPFRDVYGLGSAGDLQAIPPATRTNFNAEYGTVCLDGSSDAYQVASAWVIPVLEGNLRTPAGFFGTTPLIGHRIEKPSGSSMLDLPWDVHGALFLESAGCMAAIKRVAEYHQPSLLNINGHDVPASALDGMYGGDPSTGPPGFDLGSDRATLVGRVPGPFVVWLSFSSSIDIPRATLHGASPTGAWYEPQRTGDRGWIIWFRDSLADGQMIVIEPP